MSPTLIFHEPPVATREVDDRRRVVRVHVHLDELRLADDEHGVAERLDLVADQVRVEVRALDQKLGAVAPAPLGKGERDLRRRRVRLLGFGQGLEELFRLLEGLQHALEDQLQPKATGIHDARVAEDLQLGRCFEHRGASAGGGGRDDAQHVCLGGAGGCRRRAARLARDGEDRALGRLVHRAIGGVRGLLEGRGELRRRECALALDGASEPAKNLRQDHARVAARAHQAAV